MKEGKPPRLAVSDIRRLSDEGSFERGKAYFAQGRVLAPSLQGMTLEARCEGTERQPYSISVAFGKKGIEKALCSCPRGGFCKHIVAAMLTYILKPKSVRALKPLEALLSPLGRDELAALVGEIVEQEPGMAEVVEAFASRGGGAGGKAYAGMAARALSKEPPYEVALALQRLSGMAGRLAESGKWLEAGGAYSAFLSESVRQYRRDDVQAMDEEGDAASAVDEFAEGLGKCLAKCRDARTREAWLESLLAAVLADVELGGIDLAPSAEEALVKKATAEEWKRIEGRIRSELEKKSGWERKALEELLAGRRKRDQSGRQPCEDGSGVKPKK